MRGARESWRLLVLAIAWLPAACLGAQVAGLYEAEVPVVGRGAPAREEAVRAGLRQVLLKVVGRRDLLSTAVQDRPLGRAAGLMQRYGYRAAPEAGDGTSQWLWVRFDGPGVEALAAELGMPVWGRTRPSVLLWLAVDGGQGRRLVYADDPDLVPRLRARASRRGLPVVFPTPTAGAAAPRASDVWGEFWGPIEQASAAYAGDAILLARAYPTRTGQWEARWSLRDAGTVERWVGRGGRLHAVLETGIDEATDRLARRYGHVQAVTGPAATELRVVGINGLRDYARVVRYLRSLDVTSEVMVARLKGDKVWFRVGLRGDRRALEQIVGLGATLRPLPPGQDRGFRLLP